ncbi:MAG: glutamine amidotransferase [Candidatus Humimicrobiaceae bacterium]
MSKRIKVLFVGETVYISSKIFMGWDSFEMGRYWEHEGFFLKSLKYHDMDVTYIRTNNVSEGFPWTIEELKFFDVIVVSDVGSNTFLLSEKTSRGERTPNRLKLIEQFVEEGGGFLMWGGYLSFTGIGGKAFYKNTPIEKILPVTLSLTDDRVEVPEGFLPKIRMKDHPILNDIPDPWEGWFLSYNRLTAKEGADVITAIAEYDNDPITIAWDFKKGRSLASAVDCDLNGAAPSFLNWKYTGNLYANMVKWLAKLI